MSEEKQIRGWIDVQLTPDMPVTVLVNFLNVLNQRLVTLEDQVVVDFEGAKKTLTEVYSIQSQREAAAMVNADMQEQPEEKKGE